MVAIDFKALNGVTFVNKEIKLKHYCGKSLFQLVDSPFDLILLFSLAELDMYRGKYRPQGEVHKLRRTDFADSVAEEQVLWDKTLQEMDFYRQHIELDTDDGPVTEDNFFYIAKQEKVSIREIEWYQESPAYKNIWAKYMHGDRTELYKTKQWNILQMYRCFAEGNSRSQTPPSRDKGDETNE